MLVSAWMPARTERGLREQNQPAAAVLSALECGRARMLYSRGIRDEYRRILHHRLLRIPQGEINQRLRRLLEQSEYVQPRNAPEEVAARFSDADDLVYLETALGGGADCIVTSNGCHFSASPVRVVAPAELPRVLPPEPAERESLLSRSLRWWRGLFARGRMQEE
ncbi:PIN domain-containing protein [bacterium]|nr:PIN domain-containing protein [bacterium]